MGAFTRCVSACVGRRRAVSSRRTSSFASSSLFPLLFSFVPCIFGPSEIRKSFSISCANEPTTGPDLCVYASGNSKLNYVFNFILSWKLRNEMSKQTARPTDRLNAKWKAIMRSDIQSSLCVRARARLSPRARFPLTQWNCARSFVGLFRFLLLLLILRVLNGVLRLCEKLTNN